MKNLILIKNIGIVLTAEFDDTLLSAISETFETIGKFVKLIGGGLAGLISIVCALVAIFLLIQAVVDIMGHGQNNVVAEKCKLFLILVAVTVFAGLIARAFFGS